MSTRRALPRHWGRFSRPPQQLGLHARLARRAEGHLPVGGPSSLKRLPPTVRKDIKTSEMAAGVLVRPVCPMSDATAGGRARGSKLRSMFTDSECFLRGVRESAAQRPKSGKKWVCGLRGPHGSREDALTVQGPKRRGPGTSGAAVAAVDGADERPEIPGSGKGLI